MTEDLKKLILRAADVLQKYGAEDVFFFGSVAKSEGTDDTAIDLAVSGLSSDVFYQAMGGVLSVTRKRCHLVDLDEENQYVFNLKSNGKDQLKIGDKISHELQQLHELLEKYSSIIEKSAITKPGNLELIALGGILQLLYSGFDRIFKMIIAEFDSGFKKGVTHEADVLERMVMPTPKRTPVINKLLMEQLLPYMSFRHSFCNSYSYNLNWEKMEHLVAEAEEILLLLEVELHNFIEANC